VTITQSVTIDGGPGVAGIIASGTSGVHIVGSGTAPIVVTLKESGNQWRRPGYGWDRCFGFSDPACGEL
jgi:hypothetical protein